MSHFLIVGQKFSSLTAYLLAHDHTYTYLQDQQKTKFPDKRYKHRVLADFSTRQTTLAALEQVKSSIDGVIITYENYILPGAWIAETLGLPGLPIEAARACTDKFLMRSKFALAPEQISPAFAIVNSENDVRTFAQQHDFPLILKPANLAKSLLVTRSDSLDELLRNYQRSVELLETTYKKYAPHRNPQLLIEEFLEGSIHSVDAFVDSSGQSHVLEQVVDYQTGYDIGFDDNFHYSRLLPSRLPSDQQVALRRCAEVGIRALGMKNSPAHVEIIMTRSGPRIVEIGARSGGYRERMHHLANGIDITGAALALALGKPIEVVASRDEPCAVLELFPKIPGRFTGISHIEELKKLPSLAYFSLKVETGQFVGKAADGYKMCAVVILHHSEAAQFQRDLELVNEAVSVTTSAPS